MLILSRREGERVRLEISPGEYVWIHVLEVYRGSCRFGIWAPPHVPIVRDELIGTLPRKGRKEPDDEETDARRGGPG